MRRLTELKGAESVGRELLRNPTWAASSLRAQPPPALAQAAQPLGDRVRNLRPAQSQAFASEGAIACPPPPALLWAKLQTLFFGFYSYIISFSPRCLGGLSLLDLGISDLIKIYVWGEKAG